ncbi:haloacid dehalogenase-like hydrolase [Paraneptunicella aestuarii]|uniref:HAD family hydrolase n=1 Tax=Paraneptunicella aestuarii TaxID=2831148 RepID=UPI001E2F61C7|nr:HAD family hydrolase [Paraneptunicella aestuarii]UAA38877.1 haloacid dehalogenase-like hydrolase [Paraneptunicella aestuarii]
MTHSELASWADGQCKQAILEFVDATCSPGSTQYVEPENRIAVFDNDGTLWVEKPMNTQVTFIWDSFNLHPAASTEHHSFLGKLKDSFEHTVNDVMDDMHKLFGYAHEGLTTSQYRQHVIDWISTAQHPRFHCLYTKTAYQPMLEVLQLFHKNQFKCFIVTGGTSDFVRPWSPDIYGIDSQCIIGSSLRTALGNQGSELCLTLEPIPFYFDDGPAKVRAIERVIGKQPIAAFGNSHGDREMLQWTSQVPNTLSMLIHHTDEVREYAYSPDPLWDLGTSTLEMAKQHGWHVMDMKQDWLKIF